MKNKNAVRVQFRNRVAIVVVAIVLAVCASVSVGTGFFDAATKSYSDDAVLKRDALIAVAGSLFSTHH
jgi:cytochrome b